MVTLERIQQIFLENEAEFDQAIGVDNKFIAGLQLLQERSKNKSGSKYSTSIDGLSFFADTIEDLVDLTEDDVRMLNLMGWSLNFWRKPRFLFKV